MQKRVFCQQDSFTFQLTRFRSQSLCFLLWCLLFKLTVSSVVLFWPRVTFSSGDLLWEGANCIITKAMAVNSVFTREYQNLPLCIKPLVCTLILLHWLPDLPFCPLIVEWKILYKIVRLLGTEYLMWFLLKDDSVNDLGMTVASFKRLWSYLVS